ncbi:MAG: hypothetical protein ACR2OI_08715 [Acidimicrobiia bacterium]
MDMGWKQWFGVAAVLFAIGAAALVVLGDGKTASGEDDTGLLAGLAYFAWLLSWLGAIVSVTIGALRIWKPPATAE